MFITPKSVYS